jgi:hypothetical protein
MDGRAFLDSARYLLKAPSEANWRSAAGRAYLAVFHEARAALERWGFHLLPQEDAHSVLPARFVATLLMDLIRVEDALNRLDQLQREGDHNLAQPGSFANAQQISLLVGVAQVIYLLDQIEADPPRRAVAIGALRAVWP